jgi:gamma-glutamyltranspeptidase / glutathione hydrolase
MQAIGGDGRPGRALRRPRALHGIACLVSVLLALCVAGAAQRAAAAAPAPVLGRDGMVVTAQSGSTRAGLAMLALGGNAIDAAVAAAFAASVTQPYSAGLGGGAFLLIRLASGEVVAIDARETAPAAARADMYLQPGLPDHASLHSPLAVATPGFVAGLEMALERYGSMSLADVLEPAIALAQRGFEIGPYHAEALEWLRGRGFPERFPETGRIQFPPPGEPIEVGWRLVQRDLARTLRQLAKHGAREFYRGGIAKAIADDMAKSGGILTYEDLEGYTPVLREPVRGSYRGYEIVSFPPPSSGGIALVEALNILEGFDLGHFGAGSSASIHRITEALKFAFADRAAYLGDPEFVDVPTERLVSKRYAAALRARIDPPRWRRAPWTWLRSETAIRVPGPGLPVDDAGTTHLSTSDAAGNAVALTMTINTYFGSGMTVPGTGIVLNNEMDDFSVALDTPNVYQLVDTTGANAIAPGKRPLSSMTPTLVLHDGRLFMVTGSPGGPRIISTTLLSIVNVVDFGMSVTEAVSAPRFHHQWKPDTLYLEPAHPADVVDALRARGHHVEVEDENWSAAEAIVIDPKTGWHEGGSDPRRDGLALGYNRRH